MASHWVLQHLILLGQICYQFTYPEDIERWVARVGPEPWIECMLHPGYLFPPYHAPAGSIVDESSQWLLWATQGKETCGKSSLFYVFCGRVVAQLREAPADTSTAKQGSDLVLAIWAFRSLDNSLPSQYSIEAECAAYSRHGWLTTSFTFFIYLVLMYDNFVCWWPCYEAFLCFFVFFFIDADEQPFWFVISI